MQTSVQRVVNTDWPTKRWPSNPRLVCSDQVQVESIVVTLRQCHLADVADLGGSLTVERICEAPTSRFLSIVLELARYRRRSCDRRHDHVVGARYTSTPHPTTPLSG